MNVDISRLESKDLAALSALLAKAGCASAGDDATPQPASSKPKRRRTRDETIKYLTAEELERLFKTIKSPRDTAIFRLAYHRGLRAREVGALQFSDIDWKADRIQVNRLKGSASGQFHLCSSEVRALRAWRKVRGVDAGPLFPSRKGGGISQQMLDVLMKRYGSKAGIAPEKCHMHALKHSCATHLLDRGESIEDVQDHLGHRQIANTQIYAKFTNVRRQARDRRLRDW